MNLDLFNECTCELGEYGWKPDCPSHGCTGVGVSEKQFRKANNRYFRFMQKNAATPGTKPQNICPCCDRNYRAWRTSFSTNQLMVLDLAHRQHMAWERGDEESRWFHVRNRLTALGITGSEDQGKLTYPKHGNCGQYGWQLLRTWEREPPGERKKLDSGEYRITRRGIMFVRNLISVPVAVYTDRGYLRQDLFGVSDKDRFVTFDEVRREPKHTKYFDYEKLIMNELGP